MKRRLWLAVVLVMGLSLTGMGRLDQDNGGEIPLPDRDVSALVIDREGVSVTLTHFSINGQTMFSGKLGAGKAAVPFGQIKTATPLAEPDAFRVKLELIDQPPLTLTVERGLQITGRAKFGTYRVPLDQLKKIEILAVTEKKK